MQSLNKMPSFGDNTLSACIQAEVINMDVISDSNIEKYFKNSTLLLNIPNNSDDTGKAAHGQLKQDRMPRNSEKKEISLNQVESNCKGLRKSTIAKSKINNKTNVSDKSKTKKISLKENCHLSEVEKENINVNYIKSDLTSSANILLEECNKFESSVPCIDRDDNKSKVTLGTANDTRDTKLSISTASNSEISSKINPSVSTVGTQDRCKLASWGLPQNIFQVIYLENCLLIVRCFRTLS